MVQLILEIKEEMINVATGKARIEKLNGQYQEIYGKLDSLY